MHSHPHGAVSDHVLQSGDLSWRDALSHALSIELKACAQEVAAPK